MPVFSGGFGGSKTIQSLDTELKHLKIRMQTIKSHESEPPVSKSGNDNSHNLAVYSASF